MNYLISFSIGPVQEFISAARRTADLKAGSDLLLKIVGAAAECAKARGDIIYAGANKILFVTSNCDDPRQVTENVSKAAQDCLWQEWLTAKKEIAKNYTLIEGLADEQVRTFLETYAAWVVYDGNDYGQKRVEVERLLAARKSLRNFGSTPQIPASTEIRAKSPLDPAYECVLTAMPNPRQENESETAEHLRNPLGLKKTEFLDAISLLKRTMLCPVPSTRDFAQRRNQPKFLTNSADEDDSPPDYAYYAILHADGDDMGEQLSKFTSPGDHREFSGKITAFAAVVKNIVAESDGYLVYAGGDDVLALLPVPSAIDCAQNIAQTFSQMVGGTMSAGLAIVHYKQPLSISREQVGDAERLAKNRPGKNTLCVALHTRGGAPLHLPKPWSDWQSFVGFASHLREGEIVSGVSYELLRLASEFESWNPPTGLLQKEAERIWKRKQNNSGRALPPFPAQAAKDAYSLSQFAKELILAKFISGRKDK